MLRNKIEYLEQLRGDQIVYVEYCGQTTNNNPLRKAEARRNYNILHDNAEESGLLFTSFVHLRTVVVQLRDERDDQSTRPTRPDLQNLEYLLGVTMTGSPL